MRESPTGGTQSGGKEAMGRANQKAGGIPCGQKAGATGRGEEEGKGTLEEARRELKLPQTGGTADDRQVTAGETASDHQGVN